ncbi:MAG TPA: hypothetical protein VFO60_08560, partial [Candidatus Dormibacteraeota bacterium]|nr:hypothetical protein [Candidatus Dormibacteraeota bacterium]
MGSGGGSSWRQGGINLVRVGTIEVPQAGAFAAWLAAVSGPAGGHATRLLASGPDAFQRLAALDGFYRVHSWIAPLTPGAIPIWEISGVLARESGAQAALAQAGAEYALSGPDAALTAAQTTAGVAGQRLDLIGGEISVLLLGFALVAAVGLRRGLAAERRRLVQRGATAAQVVVSVATEIGATTVAGGVAGVAAGVAAVAIVARSAGLPWGAVLRHGPGSGASVGLVLGLWLVATVALIAVGVRRPDSGGRRGVRVLDAVAVAAAGAAAIGFARGGLDASTIVRGNDATFLLLLPALVCFAAAIAAGRLLGPLMRGAERLTRRSPPALRLAMLGLARAPARTAATAAFLVVATGLALFATGYRATLGRGADDQAAFVVPLDFTLGEGATLVTPLEAAPLARFNRIAPGVHAYPVTRQTADVPGSGTAALNPTVLGLGPGAFARLHWRQDFAASPLSSLAARVEADPQASLRGLPLPARATLTLSATTRGVATQLDLAAENAAGDVTLLRLRERPAGRFVARTPAGAALKLVGLEVSVVEGEATALAHRAAEGIEATVPRGSIILGPLRDGARTLTGWRGWVAPGSSLHTRGLVRLSYAFTTGQTVLLRRRQATDGRPLRVIASPSVARAAGPGGVVVLDFGTGRVPARIVGVASRFPDSE